MIFAAINDNKGNNTPYFKNSKGEVFKFVDGLYSKEANVKKIGKVKAVELPYNFDSNVYNGLSPFFGRIEGGVLSV